MSNFKDRLKVIYSNLILGKCIIAASGFGMEQVALALRYMTGGLFPEHSDEKQLESAMKWLSLAQDACGGNGVSASYDLKTGWSLAYPETSGYIIPTYLAYADLSGDQSFIKKAIRLADWEIEIQTPGGGVLSSPQLSLIRVFNTGQVMLGWCALYERTTEVRYLDAAIRAGEYLIRMQEADGTWRTDTYCGARTYHARIDWALLRLASLSGDQRYADTSNKNLKWVLSMQKENGWFDQCGFNNDLPIMHVIVYTLRGLLECHRMNDPITQSYNILQSVIITADALCDAMDKYPIGGIDGMIPKSFDENWHSDDKDSCLTGNVQFACFLMLLGHTLNNGKYFESVKKILKAIKMTQAVDVSIAPLRGAIGGSYPLYRGYMKNTFPNWATKFFADAMLMKMQYSKKVVVLG